MNRLRPHGLVALAIPAVLVVMLLGTRCSAPSTATPRARADSGIAGCTALLEVPRAAPRYPKIRSEFLRSQWPDLRAAGTSYVDLAVKLRSARNTDGYEAVWFYQRLSDACARHDER